MLDCTVRGRLLSITISHYVIVDGGWCELVLIVIEQILLLVRLNPTILHLSHEIDSGAPASGLKGKNFLLVFQRLRVDVMHAALWKISRRSQITYPYICSRCVMFSQRPSGFIIHSERLVGCRSTLTIIFLFGTWMVRPSIAPLLLRWNVFLWACSCVQSLITSCSLTTWLNISIGWGLLALRSGSRNRVSWWVRGMIYPLAQHRHLLPSRFLDHLRAIDIVMNARRSVIIIPPRVLLRCLD